MEQTKLIALIKRHAISAGVTFFSTFFFVLSVSVTNVDTGMAFTGAAVVAMFMTLLRAAAKAGFEAVMKSYKSEV